jgi:CubicO group peptidase (beta-lactamase class C family)
MPKTTRTAAALLVLGALAAAQDSRPASRPWSQYATAEAAGWSSARLAEIRAAAERAGSAAVLVVFRGHVLLAWGEVERRFECRSVRKSLLSGLIGVHAGAAIDLSATLGGLGIDDVPPLTAAEKQATVQDLLQSRSGVYHAAAKEPDDMKTERPPRGSARAGERWWYNNWDFNTLGVVFERRTGTTIAAGFAARFAGPLGMEERRPCGRPEHHQADPPAQRPGAST